jgi:hypothetical protein
MIPVPYCDPVRDSEWHEAESWKDNEEQSAAQALRAHRRFVELWEHLAKKEREVAPYVSNILQTHINKWEEETKHLSSTTKRVMHPSYQSIIGMGPVVVPLLLRDLEKTHRLWFWALSAITGENPVNPEDAGDIRKMVRAWIDWGKRTGRI